MFTGEFRFDAPVEPGGYGWWYLDALSDDGRSALTIITFIGSVFSPYYAAARRRRGPRATDPLDHCSFNIALYGAGGHRWAMTERGRSAVTAGAEALRIGPSVLTTTEQGLVYEFDEITVPIRRRIRGRVTVTAETRTAAPRVLDPGGRHHWWPIAPNVRVEVDLPLPGRHWSGRGYVDANRGTEPLEAGFREWHWSRAEAGPDTIVTYDVVAADGTERELALRIGADGAVAEVHTIPALRPLTSTLWRVPRVARGAGTRVRETFEDTPFYNRSLLDLDLSGDGTAPMPAVHESLDLERFASRWVQTLLPFRMPRHWW